MNKDLKVILLSGKGAKAIPTDSRNVFSNSIEWLISAFNLNGLDDINIVGGKDIEKLGLENPKVKFIYNPIWTVSGEWKDANSICFLRNIFIRYQIFLKRVSYQKIARLGTRNKKKFCFLLKMPVLIIIMWFS